VQVVERLYRDFPPLSQPLSRLVLGTLLVDPDVLDEWVRVGGNIVDTAHAYSAGHAERALGAWLGDRDMAVLSKGAHPASGQSRVTREDIAADLRDSIARLGRPIDLYLLHRDDPSVPVGPIVESLNEHIRGGRIRAIGASNWTCERIDEANAYAAANGLEGFCCSSVHLSLATQNEEHWPDTLSATQPEIREWHERTQMPLFAWSAQARGFFAGHASGSVERVYDNADNRERRRRAAVLAAQRGCTANQVALAWVLAQPFPVFAVFGARTVMQLREAVGALEVSLSADEARWLDLRA
jgi:aryl-alcohol dehydrogenase-like predicted oxidoreductase